MDKIKLSKAEARAFLLEYHFLSPSSSLKNKKGILEYFKRVGSIQYDPLNIVGNNHELVLQSRILSFTPSLVNELLYKERLLFDGWDKNMSICLIEDWPNFNRRRKVCFDHYSDRDKEVMEILPEVRKKIKEDLKHKSLQELEGNIYEGEWICDWTTKPNAKAEKSITHYSYGYASQVVILDENLD